MPFSFPYCTTQPSKKHSLAFGILVVQFIVDVVSAILAIFKAECDHAAILAIMAKVTNNLVFRQLSVAPNTLVSGKHLVDYRHDDALRRNDGNLVDSLANRLLRYAAAYRIPVVVYSASILHNNKSPLLIVGIPSGKSMTI